MSEEILNQGEPTSTDSSSEPVETTEESTEQAGTQDSEVVEQETETQDAEPQEQAEEDDSDYLPDEQLKEFPPEVLAKYAKRYGYTQEEIAADPRLQRALKDKINSDIEIARSRQQANEQTEEDVEEPTQDDTPVELSDADKEAQFKQHFETLDKWAEAKLDPRVAKQAHTEFMAIWKLPEDKQPQAFSKVMTKYVANIAATALPDILNSIVDPKAGSTVLDQLIENRYPGLREENEKRMYGTAWESVRSSNESYAKLPQYGTPEFRTWAREQAAKFPEVQEMKFDGTLAQQAAKRYSVLVKLATGQQTDPQLAKKAVETGKKQATETLKRRELGKALGSGQSKSTFTPSGSDNLLAQIQKHNAGMTIGNK